MMSANNWVVLGANLTHDDLGIRALFQDGASKRSTDFTSYK